MSLLRLNPRQIRVVAVFSLSVLMVATVFGCGDVSGREDYEAARDESHEFLMRVFPIGENERRWLTSKRLEWDLVYDEPSRIENDGLLEVGVSNTLNALVEIASQVPPEFSRYDRERNERNALIMRYQGGFQMTSVDGMIHVAPDVAFVRVNPDVILVYEEDAKGVATWLYRRPAP